MKILVDADGCPVVAAAVRNAADRGLECVIVCDTAHEISYEGARTVVVSKGADSADFALVNMVAAGDIVVTQDYGLAAMCLAKGGKAVDQNGMAFTDGNMDALLFKRHETQKARKAGVRVRGPEKRAKYQDEDFDRALKIMLGA